MKRPIALLAGAALATVGACGLAAAPAAQAAPQTCTRTVNYQGGPFVNGNGDWQEQVILYANSCNNKFRAAFECKQADGAGQWVYGNVVQQLYMPSNAICPGSDTGWKTYGYQYLSGSTWVYVNH